ncbi:hypothetical protein HK104_001978 [Borealophlyctis nickersoniae]|nr:hypothetical protein HK104_001978 [Borealophlyctis nickersoniae]
MYSPKKIGAAFIALLATATTNVAAQTAAQTTVKVLMQPEAYANWAKQYHAEWSKSSGIVIEYQEAPTFDSWSGFGAGSDDSSEYLKYLGGKLEADSASLPDIFAMDIIMTGVMAPHLLKLGQFDKNGNFTGDYVNELGANVMTQDPNILVADIVDGNLVALPIWMNIGMMYYREDLLKKYKFTTDGTTTGAAKPPETWDEMQNMSEVILAGEKAADSNTPLVTGWVGQFAQYEGGTCNAIELICSCGGGMVVESNKTVSVNSPGAIEIYTKFRKMVTDKKGVVTTDTFVYREDQTYWAFAQGGAIFSRQWDDLFPTNDLLTPWTRSRGGVVGIAPIPGCKPEQKGAAILGGWHLGINKDSAKKIAAAKVLSFMTSYQYQFDRAVQLFPYWPTHPSIYKDPVFCNTTHQATMDMAYSADTTNSTFYQVTSTTSFQSWCDALSELQAVPRPGVVAGLDYAQLTQAIYTGQNDILFGIVSPNSGLNLLAVTISKLLGIELPADTLGFLSGGGKALSVLGASGMGVCAMTSALFVVFRDAKVIRTASPAFMHLILFGLAMSYSTVFLYIDLKRRSSCLMIPVWLAVSFALVTGSILAKTWRIRTIFAARIRIGKVSDWKTMRVVGYILIAEAISLSIWLGVAPPEPEIKEISVTNRQWECAMTGPTARTALGGIVLFINIFVLLATTVLAYMIRDISAQFNESKMIGLAMYNVVVFVVIIPVISSATGQPIVIPVGILLITSIVYGILFIPKLLVAFHGPSAKKDGRKQTDSERLESIANKAQSTNGSSSVGGGADTLVEIKTGAATIIDGQADVRIANSKFMLAAARWIKRRLVVLPEQGVVSEIPLEADDNPTPGTTIPIQEFKILQTTKSETEGFRFLAQMGPKLFFELETVSAPVLEKWMQAFQGCVGSFKRTSTRPSGTIATSVISFVNK